MYARSRLADETAGDIWELEGSPESGFRITNKRSKACGLSWMNNKLGCHAPKSTPAPTEDQVRWFFQVVPKKKIAEKIEKAKDEGVGATQEAGDGLVTFLYNARFPMRRIGVTAGLLRATETPFVSPDQTWKLKSVGKNAYEILSNWLPETHKIVATEKPERAVF